MKLLRLSEHKDKYCRVLEQPFRCHNFNPTGDDPCVFEASNGVSIYSIGCPMGHREDKLYTRGDDHSLDNCKVFCTRDQYDRYVEAVEEYNRVVLRYRDSITEF